MVQINQPLNLYLIILNLTRQKINQVMFYMRIHQMEKEYKWEIVMLMVLHPQKVIYCIQHGLQQTQIQVILLQYHKYVKV